MDMLMQIFRFGFGILLTLGLAACGGGDEYEGFDASVTLSTPNRFLTFFNRQGDLPAGTYTLVAATAGLGQSGSFSVTRESSGGSTTLLASGIWIFSGGQDWDPTCGSGNLCFPISVDDAKGASFTLNTALDGVLYLVDSDGAAPQLVATANAGGAGVAETLKFSASAIDETGYASAYYAAVDPGDARTTAQAFWSLHQFDAPAPDVHVVFRDSKDLGYGRDMYMSAYTNASVGSSCGPPGAVTIAFFVRNFSVEIVEGFAYGPVNLEAAIAEDLQHHVGTNAIEFGYGRDDIGDTCGSEPMAKFYTFEPVYNPNNAPHPRRLRVDLDARGDKAMPQPCVSCHGGKLRPLDRFGRFVAIHANDSHAPATHPPSAGDISDIGNTKARLQAFEVDTFEFSAQMGHRRVDYEEGLRLMNSAIYCTYPGSAGHPACAAFGGGVAAQTDFGEWSGDFGRDMMLGWYGDDGVNNALNNVSASFDGSFVPAGWTAGGGAPAGADTLFTEVVGPNCFVCHGKRGTEVGSNLNASGDGKDIDFRSWDKFISHADEIERLVYDEGKMPLGLLNFQNFWGDQGKAALLASFIEPEVTDSAGFQARRYDANGNIIEPGSRVVARAGPDRVTQPGAAITLSAEASLFADKFSWQVVAAPLTADPTFSNTSSMRTDFSATIPGTYTIRLTAASSESGASRSDTLNVEVDPALAVPPRDLIFYTNISTRLGSCAGACHSGPAPGLQPGVPVWWVADGSQPLGIPASASDPPSLGFFEQVMTRVNLEHVEDSLILKKPSGVHHYGDLQVGFDTSLAVGAAGRADYDMFVNWIAEGAACGGSATQCVR